MPEENQREILEICEALENYYGTAMVSGFPMAVFDLGRLDRMSEEELRKLAEELGV